jgi:hypothetical protein
MPRKVPKMGASGCRPVLRCDVQLLVTPNFSRRFRSLHTVEAEGSIPSTPTQDFNHLGETWSSVKPVRDEFFSRRRRLAEAPDGS